MAKLYLFIGYPGAGKTTVAKWIAEATGATHIWADQERQQMFHDPTHSSAESRELYDYLNERTADLLHKGKSVVFDTNFNFYKDREHLRNIAQQAGAESVIIWIQTDKAIAKHRAVEDSHDQPTRLFGNMDEAVFERIAGHLQPPQPGEDYVALSGVDLTKDKVIQALHLA